MKLSQLFTGVSKTDNRGNGTGRSGLSQYARTAELNRQIQSLVPGQTIRGEIVARNGNEVQIRLSEDMVMNARVDQSINLELGKNLTFEVKSNGGTLSLSPLFTNIAVDATVLKALDMASLPVNETTVEMTEQLMKAGLPVNRNSLQQVYREINSFPDAEVSDVVNLHKLQLPVNEANMQQMESYRNLTHQLIKGMTSILDALPEAVNSMMAEGNIQGVAGLYGEIFSMIQEGTELQETAASPEDVTEENGVLSPEEAAGESVLAEGDGKLTIAEPEAESSGADKSVPAGQPDSGSVSGTAIPPETRTALAGHMRQALEELQLSPEETNRFGEAVQRFAQGEMGTTEFLETAGKLLDAARRTEGGVRQLQNVFSGKEFQSVLTSQIKEMWTLRPEEVAQPRRVEEFYRHLDRQLKVLTQALEIGGQENSKAFQAVTNLSQSVDFLNQLNQMYTYVQLPLHLQQSEAHGDLYVYTNKRSLADNDGKVSALLHLDMEHLGPVDVYVTLQASKVATKFYVADDEILDFIEDHMDLLTKRLEKRGYSCSISMTRRGEKENDEQEKKGGLAPLLQQGSEILLSHYAFDVRT